MRIGKFKVGFNYGILKGFIDAIGLVLIYLMYQTVYAYFKTLLISPDKVIQNIYPNGVPIETFLPGLIFPAIALIAVILSVVYMFIPHKEPKGFIITEDNAQKYYDLLMIGNSIMRILILFALWDYTYISQSNVMFGNESWVSPQAILDIIVGALVIYILRGRIAKFAEKKDSADSGDK